MCPGHVSGTKMRGDMRLRDSTIIDYLRGNADDRLFAMADSLTRQVHGSEVFLRAIIEFSNVCDKHCHYCGLRAPNQDVSRYRLSPEAILQAAEAAALMGAGTIVLQSGDDISYTAATIGGLIREIKQRHPVAVTLSLGDRDLGDYAFWRRCGADRCLLKLESTDAFLYKRLRQGEYFAARLHRLEALRALGYEVGSGVIAGLPGTTLLHALRDIHFLTQLNLDMLAVGPFVPHPQTPMRDAAPGSVGLSQRITALLRLLNPHANIPATSALDALRPGSRGQALRRGCNVLMPSLTPEEHRKDYSIYPGKNDQGLDIAGSLALAVDTIIEHSLLPSNARGDAKRRPHAHQSATRSAPGHHPHGPSQCGQVLAD